MTQYNLESLLAPIGDDTPAETTGIRSEFLALSVLLPSRPSAPWATTSRLPRSPIGTRLPGGADRLAGQICVAVHLTTAWTHFRHARLECGLGLIADCSSITGTLHPQLMPTTTTIRPCASIGVPQVICRSAALFPHHARAITAIGAFDLRALHCQRHTGIAAADGEPSIDD